ncbi:MAG: hypothetical protein KME16_01155 [Scytolyngbya sp. HA4215-MV1]|jgi:pathogenesis-related protein 1|nr:hypothetical protein [Scytolyngbya sp. HA4215-MV1]
MAKPFLGKKFLQQRLPLKTVFWNVKFILPAATLSLLIFGSLSLAPKNSLQRIGFPSFNTAAQAQTGSRFTVGQQIVVKLDDGYYFATVDKVYQKDGFTMIDFSWELNGGGGGSGSYPATDADLFSVEEAGRQNFTIVNANAGNPPAANTNTTPPAQTAPVVPKPAQVVPNPTPAVQTTPAPANGNTGSTCSGTNQLTNAEIQEILRVHNAARAEVNVPPLKWNCKLADFAQSWVDRDVWEHSSGNAREKILGSYSGENLAAAAPSSANIATDGPTGWWGEKAFWNNATGSCQAGKACGHYTQMVWRNTTEVGCGLNRKSSAMGDDWKQNSAYLSCVYNPGGNYGGQKPF